MALVSAKHCTEFVCLQHAMLSPAEAHSGWEDHNGGDLMHYIHHGKFDSFPTAVPFTKPKEWGCSQV